MSKESALNKNMWKWLVLALLAVGSVYLTYPVKDKIRLGLDLKGGSSFTLGVDDVRLRDKILESNPECENDAALMEAEVNQRLQGCDDRVVEIVRRRVDAMGTNEPLIQPIKDKHQILVQLPGADAATRDAARDRLERMAYLEFRLVPENESKLIAKLPKDAAPPGYRKAQTGYVRTAEWATLSQSSNYVYTLSRFGLRSGERNVRFILKPVKDDITGKTRYYEPHFVERKSHITGSDLKRADFGLGDPLDGYVVNFELNDDAAERFRRLTSRNIDRQLAIVLDDELVSAPVIRSEIGESCQISGNFRMEDAKRLAADLNAGALPAPLKILAESTVDPTVGQDAIASGKTAALIGFALVALFMLVYYRYAGVVADIALFLDVALLPAALFVCAHLLGVFVDDPSMAGEAVQLPVLTMPGIAGLVLTLGMAVDANVIVFERIREEFQRGAAVGKAVENGYARAFTAILDSNLTTIITGAILYTVGTGPVRGFAIMLTGGVVISMFTAVVVTRLVIDHTTNPASGKAFKMMQFFRSPSVDFMKYGKRTLIASLLVIVASLALFGYRLATNPGKVLAVDLTGGEAIVYTLADKDGKPAQIDIGQARKALDPIDNAMLLQAQGEGRLLVKTGVTRDSGSKLVYEIVAGADRVKAGELSRAVTKVYPDATIRMGEVSENVVDGKTNCTAMLVVKTSDTTASAGAKTQGMSLAEHVAVLMKRAGVEYKADAAASSEVDGVATEIVGTLRKTFPDTTFAIASHDSIGSVVGDDLRKSGTKAVVFSLIAILIYVAFRFKFGFGLGGLVALTHDALISLGLFSLCGRQVSLIVITALLTIIGYSINDTVVVFDRIREQLQRDKRSSFRAICNASINACLGRTVITSLTTFFAVAALFMFGDGSIYDFALTMLIGVVAGTYSSIFIATPVMAMWYRGKRPDFDEAAENEAK